MSFTAEKAEEILAKLEEKQGNNIMTKNYEALALEYHPDGVLIHKGVGSYYGRDAIKEALRSFLDQPTSGEPQGDPLRKVYGSASLDGEYLIRRGFFKMGGSPKEHPFEQIYKKQDGEYLIYLDAFEFSQ